MPITALDSIDRRILVTLQRNSRVANAELAKAVGLSPSPCLRRVRRLEKLGFIRGIPRRPRSPRDRSGGNRVRAAPSRLDARQELTRRDPKVAASRGLLRTYGRVRRFGRNRRSRSGGVRKVPFRRTLQHGGCQGSSIERSARNGKGRRDDAAADYLRRQTAASQKTLSIEPVGPCRRLVKTSSSRR